MPQLQAQPLTRVASLEFENQKMMEELNRLYSEIDRYRVALEKLKDHPGEVGRTAKAALAGRGH